MKSQTPQVPPPQNRGNPQRPGQDFLRRGSRWPTRQGGFIWYLLIMFAILLVWQEVSHQAQIQDIPYSQFKKLVTAGRVTNVVVGTEAITGQILAKATATGTTNSAAVKTATTTTSATNLATTRSATTNAAPSSTKAAAGSALKPGSFRTLRVTDPNLVRDLEKAHITYTGKPPNQFWQLFLVWVLPIGIMVLIWRFLSKRMAGLGQSAMGFGTNRAKLVAEQDTKIMFSDVAGCDEAKHDLQEVVAFLKDPNRYRKLGATIPKGILLIGPPGTGKTLLARAVAGEARVPFYLISGSDFVEMFVGVGAARVRSLFENAKSKAPCIVFIDELDAIGRQRGVRIGPVNDEREQTLNQLLVGMDGFEANAGVIILAATNRPEVLDPALLRPGRFDRHVMVDVPDLEGRLAILKIHVRGKKLAGETDLRRVAAQTPGLAGADLANVVNEAALLAASRGAKEVTQSDLDDAVVRVVAGPERRSRRLSDEEKTRVAYHEVGHALTASYSKHADPVHKISIIPRGRAALGYTMQLPARDQYLASQSELLDRITVLLSGRAAEEVVFSEISTGAESDLQRATNMARQMVAMFGMSDVIGLAYCARREEQFLNALPQRDCSEETAREIDQEVKKILDHTYARAKSTLEKHRAALERIARELLERETMDAKTFMQMLKQSESGSGGQPVANLAESAPANTALKEQQTKE